MWFQDARIVELTDRLDVSAECLEKLTQAQAQMAKYKEKIEEVSCPPRCRVRGYYIMVSLALRRQGAPYSGAGGSILPRGKVSHRTRVCNWLYFIQTFRVLSLECQVATMPPLKKQLEEYKKRVTSAELEAGASTNLPLIE